MSSIRYPESLSNTNRGDRWCLKTRAMYRMKNEGNYTFVFSQISKLKNWEKSLVLSIIINKYNTHCTFFHVQLLSLVHASLHPFLQIVHPQPSNPSASVAIKKKSARHFRFYAASDVITRTHTHLSRMIFFFFICTRPIDSPFHPRMPTNRGIHGRVVGRIIRAMISRLERVCLTPLISRQGSYRCQDLGGGDRSDRGALSSLFAPHSSLV